MFTSFDFIMDLHFVSTLFSHHHIQLIAKRLIRLLDKTKLMWYLIKINFISIFFLIQQCAWIMNFELYVDRTIMFSSWYKLQGSHQDSKLLILEFPKRISLRKFLRTEFCFGAVYMYINLDPWKNTLLYRYLGAILNWFIFRYISNL